MPSLIIRQGIQQGWVSWLTQASLYAAFSTVERRARMLSPRSIPVKCLVDLGMGDIYSINAAHSLCSLNLIPPHNTSIFPVENDSHGSSQLSCTSQNQQCVCEEIHCLALPGDWAEVQNLMIHLKAGKAEKLRHILEIGFLNTLISKLVACLS